ncbi:hypothetical protein CW751_04715 [Brumimicrobium salinarum]|uniref:HmuY protein n=1 Tax=Brumimicrobium salinarum TaxID=2058658 RepID=A0A2I0R451_9FLAO|nr:HmuY family protein [Brumimicrobium salinarum]PKR81362.1 hypothetical protein CW751_04715 [Brumimicrobium salinarum]
MRIVIIALIIVLFSSCLKEEIPVPKREKGDVETASVSMGGNYAYQVYFDFSANEMTGKETKDLWDIGFETGENGDKVITNTAKNMMVYLTDKTEMDEVLDENNYVSGPVFDNETGNLDSTGIGNWQDGKVRIIDMGYNSAGQAIGWYKLKVTGVDETTYTFEFAEIEATNATSVSLLKQEEYNFTYYSMLNNAEIQATPKSTDWDIVFTQYIHQFYEPVVTPYLVTGCITNRNNRQAAMVTELDFEAIDLAYASNLVLSENINTIGFGWKDFVGDEYFVNSEISYIIKDHEGIFYKLRFVDFYNETGEKGNPVWEFVEL